MAKTTKKAESAAVKTEKTETVKTETAAKKPVAKKTETAAKKTAVAKKPAAKKAAAPKAAKATTVKLFVEYQGRQVSQEDVLAAVMAVAGKAKAVEIYVKPEDGAAYYVADGVSGKVEF